MFKIVFEFKIQTEIENRKIKMFCLKNGARALPGHSPAAPSPLFLPRGPGQPTRGPGAGPYPFDVIVFLVTRSSSVARRRPPDAAARQDHRRRPRWRIRTARTPSSQPYPSPSLARSLSSSKPRQYETLAPTILSLWPPRASPMTP